MLKRITGRRISRQRPLSTTSTPTPPKVEGICDVDGSKLEQRKDDTEEVFHERMKVYHEKTAAVIEYYRSHGNRFSEVNGDLPPDEVTNSIRTALLALRHHPEKQ